MEHRGDGVLGLPDDLDRRSDDPADLDVLDAAVAASLRGAHAHLALRRGRVVRYRADVAPFAALPADADETDWADLAALCVPSPLDGPHPLAGPPPLADLGGDEAPRLRGARAERGQEGAGNRIVRARGGSGDGSGADVLLMELPRHVPEGWLRVGGPVRGVQMVGVAVEAGGFDEPDEPDGPVTLGPGDVDDMLALARATRPGPFEPGTPAMGRYLGVRREGVLVAMAGERLRPSGWVEVSAVCAHPSVRGQGLGSVLVRAVVAGIRADGGRALLHVGEDSPARRLYQRLGFAVRRGVELHRLRPPALTGDGDGSVPEQRATATEPRRG